MSRTALQITKNSSTRTWVRALEMTASIPSHPGRIFANVIDDLSEKFGDAPALISESESLTYSALVERCNRYARWALDQGLKKGDAVCLFMPNRPEYMAVWVGITRIGGVVALLNTNLTGSSLAHCINIVRPKHIITDPEMIDLLNTALPSVIGQPKLWFTPSGSNKQVRAAGAPCSEMREFMPIEDATASDIGESDAGVNRASVSLEDCALYIYTSGTTGLPKAARVSHMRLMQWSHWFAGLMECNPTDRMYNCLPMYHSVGGVLATGAVLIGGGSVVIRSKFSASQFWNDIIGWDCTLFQYIGELCRYLLHTELSPHETEHRIRMCCGNGLRPDVWTDFQRRFHIPQILEFYAATEGNVSLFNIEGKPGAIGRIPPFLAHRVPVTLVRFDVENEAPVRNDQGLCIRCAPNEVGEAIGQVLKDPSSFGSRFEGYTSGEASEKKILRDVFEAGDAWFRTGDLMRRDEKGYFYFVDRIGDTFRWKGENVSTTEVTETIAAYPGVIDAVVYGVTIPGTEGRAGMAAVVVGPSFDLTAFRHHLERLPEYARPLFLRLRCEIELTATFKPKKQDLSREGYHASATGDAIYLNDPQRQAFVRVDEELYDRIRTGRVRL